MKKKRGKKEEDKNILIFVDLNVSEKWKTAQLVDHKTTSLIYSESSCDYFNTLEWWTGDL